LSTKEKFEYLFLVTSDLSANEMGFVFDVFVPVQPSFFRTRIVHHKYPEIISGRHSICGAGIQHHCSIMGNSDDDEGSDSDIEQMFQQAHALKQKQRHSLAPSDDEEDDDHSVNGRELYSSQRRKKSKTDRMSIKIALRTEKQHLKEALNARRLSDDDLLEEEDEDPQAELEASRIAAATILIDDDSSDTERARLPPVTRPALPQPPPPSLPRLPPPVDLLARAALPPPGPSLLRLQVVCTIFRSSPAGAAIEIPVADSVTTCTVDIIETATVQALMDRLLTHYLQRNPQTNVIGLQYQHHTLHNRQTLDMYNIPERNATVQATIHSSDHVLVTPKTLKTTTPRIEGPSVVLILRRAAPGKTAPREDRLTIGTQQALQGLVEQYALIHNIPSPSQIALHFDGDRLNLQKTPAFYEMDGEDLIDVQVVEAAAPAPRPKGPAVVLILRRADAPKATPETRLRLGKQQALQGLVEQYAQMHGIGTWSKISLYFDGDRLNLEKTPLFYEMDEEDLIDVKVAP
jgi:Ubiquitin-2 like Rad60 SUMO-like